jgi:hypothetical protein
MTKWAPWLALLAAGCAQRPAPPATYPATGVVKFTTGQPFPGGVISLTSTADPTVTMEAPVGDDGAFTLGMVFDNRRLDGARPGTYDVLVSSRFVAGQGVRTYALPAGAVIRAEPTALVITVDPAKGKS